MSYDFDRSRNVNSRNFEQRPFLSRDGRELKEDYTEENSDNEFAVFEQEMAEPVGQKFEPQFLDNEEVEEIEEDEEAPAPARKGRSTAKEVEQDFDKPIRKKSKKSPAKVGYLGFFDWKGLSTGEKISKAGWIFMGFLFLRLIFMDSGIIDWVKMEKRLDARLGDLQSIQAENNAIKNEIDMIKNNTGYQKKLVRDHLGAIDGNEYLILFPTETEGSTN